MLKTMMLGAFVAVSVCAMAQSDWRDSDRGFISANGKSHWDIKHQVCRMDQYLSGGDAYDFEVMLERMPGNAEDALISGLFAAHRQSCLIRDQVIAARFPDDAEVMAETTGMDQAVMAEESEKSMRPMRMVMKGDGARDINYEDAYYIVTADLNSTQRTEYAYWWDGTNDHDRDLVVRMLKIEARRADEPIYASLYTHHVYPMIVIN